MIGRKKNTAVAIWLLTGVFMIMVQIVLGGITRLTDSGLSITEWKPILGAVPPSSNGEWQKAFDSYKQIAQYKQLHAYFSLEDFKAIYFWEWLHRLWGRMIGLVFIIPFLFFVFTRQFSKQMVKPLIVLFFLGGLQGLIGWIMVQSGLNDEDLYVSHIRLAIHFMVALILLVYTFWFALKLLVPEKNLQFHSGSRNFLLLMALLLFLQLVYGAFMAGLKAAAAAPTWPVINGEFVPSNMISYGGRQEGFFSALINNPITVHFVHRNLAYIILILTLVWAVLLKGRRSTSFFWARWLPVFFVCMQAILGIASVLVSPERKPQQWGWFESFALAHQFVAMLFLLSVVFTFYLVGNKKKLNYNISVDPQVI